MATLTKGLIGEQDIKRWDGTGGKTFSRETSTGGRIVLNKIGYEVDALISYGNGTNYTAATINRALAEIGSVTTRLVLSHGTWDIDADITFPANITVVKPAGCILNAESGVTVTYNGPVEADADSSETGAGTFTMGSPTSVKTSNTSLQLKGDARLIRFKDTGASGKEFGIRSDGGNFYLVENTGTESSPTWTTRFILPAATGAKGDLFYSSAANQVDKLAIGTAYQLLRVNAAATAPEWGGYYDGLYPEVYGAVGDGSTDDTTAIQDCIDAAPAGSIIQLSAKTYKITDTLTIDKALTITGYGNVTKLDQVTASKGCFEITASDVSISRVWLHGVGHAAYDASELAVKAYGANYAAAITRLKIKDCYFSDWGHGAVYLKYVTDFEVRNNQMNGIHYEAILTMSCVRGDISYNRIDDVPGSVATSNESYGIALSRDQVDSLGTDPRSSKITVKGNIVSNVHWEAIDSHGGSYLTIANNIINSCKRGIMVGPCNGTGGTSKYAPLMVSITGNVMDSGVTNGTSDVGIFVCGAFATTVQEYAYGCTISGNTIIGFGDEDGSLTGGIEIYATMGATISCNALYLSGLFGILGNFDNYNAVITGNSIIDTFSNTTDGVVGINLLNNYHVDFIVSDNTIATLHDPCGTYRVDTTGGIAVKVGNEANNSGKLGLVTGDATMLLKDDGSKVTKNLN